MNIITPYKVMHPCFLMSTPDVNYDDKLNQLDNRLMLIWLTTLTFTVDVKRCAIFTTCT